MFLKSTGFKFFAKIMGGNYVFCCSSHISFNPTSHLNLQVIGVRKTHSLKNSDSFPCYFKKVNNVDD